jgi:error-prone DNA polymerase
MLCANFTGGEAEELRRALGSRRSMTRMAAIEDKLRKGMSLNNIDPKTQDTIVDFINSFALYGFPESHAASFALIAYASAFLKQHYLAAFTAALLNNQPMGFYHPASIVKDAQRHGLKIKPVDVMVSDWKCTLEQLPVSSEQRQKKREPILRMGLSYVRGLKETVAAELLKARAMRAFASIDELTRRVPSLSKKDLTMLAQVGALNNIGRTEEHKLHRRHAIWQVERAALPSGPLLDSLAEEDAASPLAQMDTEERLVADYHGTGVTVGPHPMAYRRAEMQRMNICRAIDLAKHRNGAKVRVAGCVIARQRPGTAHGFIFLSLEDETGIANVIIKPDVYDEDRMTVLNERFLLVEGVMQHIDNVINVRAETVRALNVTAAEIRSHDFH